ncbi:MAG: nuclear transport factor 2 family protein [Pseudomonadota bacterium]
MPDTALNLSAFDPADWAGATPDETLAAGATEYSVSEARDIVRRFAEVTTSCDPDAYVEGFTEDQVTSFNKRPDIRGRPALRDFMAPSFARWAAPGVDYLCRKTLRALAGDTFGVVWLDSWTDPDSGGAMRGKGLEFWKMREGRIARWDAAYFVWKP